MDWLNLLTEIFELCILPLLGILTKYLVDYLTQKKEQMNAATDDVLRIKYTTLLFNTINECVIATNQTYVDSLKASGSFNKEAQEIAFETTYNNIMAILSEDAKEYLAEIYGDLELYIKQKIEADTKLNKDKQRARTEEEN